ncbi:hypothetical protein VCRA2122O339_50148 [Vibrio crassostreae]|nr:hypothetical protein VCRA2120E331_10150 [Vibrio crassostreae]CAK3294390.1 hypothetical protein VCRA2127O345_10150 [Vibrio crassostreae]CAK3307063.1 hypothetical protein VCRA2120E330_10150 [Vibrio crassostreae]CAK3330631.1 hypothetical protein VCRA2122O338_10150 [Vibrio crassostreae]CAK3395132.1 hypothetical protein VCRA2122O340_10136 [Vibrio crassostreae]
MKKAEYQKVFALNAEITFKPTSRQKKLLIKVAKKKETSVNEYSCDALTKSLIEEDDS